MKFITKITLLTMFLVVWSCRPYYYQVYNTKNNNNIQIKGDVLVYEDTNCTVVYDLWADGGNFSLKFINKTNDNIYVHLDESFYAKNGMAYNFFNNRIYSKSRYSSISNSNTVSGSRTKSSISSVFGSKSVQGYNAYDLLQTNKLGRANSVGVLNTFGVSNTFTSTEASSGSISQIEEKIMIIPKKSAKIIYGFYINKNLLKFSELTEYPKENAKSTIQFTKENSPLHFSNFMSYSLKRDDKLIKIDNEFYVSELINYNSKELIEMINKDANGKVIRPRRYFKESAPNKFYVKYNKDIYSRSE